MCERDEARDETGSKMTSSEITKPNEKKVPKVFISYSWTTQQHQDQVKEWADRLMSDGVEVIIDIYDLKSGQDKYDFMEKMVKDATVTNVLVFCDRGYVEKADERKRGVGTESLIISQEIYEQVDQTKFIPIVCEFNDDGAPFLPIFLKSRMYIDFSSPEKANANWERLIRHLYGKPEHVKPRMGVPPAYLEATSTPTDPVTFKFDLLRRSILDAQTSLPLYRKEFLDDCIKYADELRVRDRPKVDNLDEKILEDCRKLSVVRDHIVDWVILEARVAPSPDFSEALVDLLEKLKDLSSRPDELNAWNDAWFEAHRLFAFETFLYVIAALLKVRAFGDLNNIFTSHFLLPTSERNTHERFMRFDGFWTESDQLAHVLSSDGIRYISPAAEVVKRQANRDDVPFSDLIQADLLAMLASFIPPRTRTWFPQLMFYSRYRSEFPFFVRASQHKHYANLATITGVANSDMLIENVKEGLQRINEEGWHNFSRGRNPDFWYALNVEHLNSIR